MPETYLALPLELQVALGGGYLAHAVAHAGLRRAPGATELALRSLAFGLIAVMVMRAASGTLPVALSAALAMLAAVGAGAFWRRFGMGWSVRLFSGLGVSREDGTPDAWSRIIQAPGLNVTQLAVHLVDGRILYHTDADYSGALAGGLYFGSDGSLVMVVGEEVLPDGTRLTREDVSVPGWGTRLTVIPAGQVARVEIRTNTPTS